MEPSAAAIAAHDQQRQLPESAFQTLITGLVTHLLPHQPCLDAGAGSGMITVPLARAGVAMTAIDTSRAMLDKLQERAAGIQELSLVRGDLTVLPFAAGSLGSVLVANVFHLIADWKQALDEVVRVLVNDGVFLVNLGGAGTMPEDLAELTDRFMRQLQPSNAAPVPLTGPMSREDFETEIRARGLRSKPPIVVTYDDLLTPDGVIRRLERNQFARSWNVPDGQIARVAQECRAWARETLGSLDRPFPRTQRIRYAVYAK